ncbi:MAG: S9 family peptidase [Gammaproteobacteria bacterium]|nr:S9 family peptidase [Gammaproteobacteria bacterium]MBU1553361.1 S9 family peptidase [Gammaproteobacteria bacterium]MBU2069204.1 S9 family peptidase [Gammaproteobacteria bacterium]MBU2182299.1 S9 family peptidase [Gammaproteobacteria bacterium]MBU2204929.1 S9 family peptidase [Gammaproteobacteria bacterium]
MQVKLPRFVLTLSLLLGGVTMADAKQLELERLFADPALSGTTPRSLTMAPDGSRVTYLKGKANDANRLDLWQYQIKSGQHSVLVDADNLVSGAEVLSDEEKARRERMRLFASGIISYSWSKNSDALLFPLNGDLYYYQLKDKTAKKLTHTSEFETDATISPTGRYVAFIRAQNLFVLDIASGKETQLTFDGGGDIKNGMAEFVAQEEMGRMTGYWWAPDDSKIAFTRTDESGVAEVVRNEIYADEIKLFNQRYPYTGTANAKIQLGVVTLQDGSVNWISHGDEDDIYLPRVDWSKSSRYLSYQWQNRSQQLLELRLVDLHNNQQKVLLSETSNTWLNLHDDLHFLDNQQGFIWASERDGYKHLYYFDFDGKLLRQLTSGAWVVDELDAVNEKLGMVYFTGRKDTPLERHLYQVSLKDGDIKRLTEAGYDHALVLAKDGSSFIDSFSNVSTPNKVALRAIDGRVLTWLEHNELNSSHPLTAFHGALNAPRFGTLKAEDGQTMHYRMFAPATFAEGKKYPVIVSVYGGPHAQRVTNSWSPRDLYLHYLVQQGYLVFQLDNRGSYNRGKAFEDPIYKKLGDVELRDQIRGVEYLRSLPYVAADKIAIYGHSYGGYMAIMAMFKAGDYFAAGVSGAPVTDWALYDTHYTERYLGHPETNAQGYSDSAVFPYADGLTGDLLIYHGMADDNVLFTHSTKLYKQLQDKGLMFDMMNYPGSKHSMFGQPVQTHLHKSITQFFDRHLK